MKKSTILRGFLTTALIAVGLTAAFAQPATIPGVNGQTLSQHGYNAAGAPVVSENTDSVTTGSVMRYYVLPDATANPSYTSPLGGSITDAFAWTFTGATGTAAGVNADVAGFGAFDNYQQVTWSGNGTINLNVQENSPAPASCTGPLTTIPIAILPVPTGTFGADPGSVCTNTPNTQVFTLPVTLSTAVLDGNVRLNYTVYNPDASVLIAAQDLDLDEAAVSFNVTLTGAAQYGNYYAVINTVTDRVSRKPVTDITGTITDNRIDLFVYRTPVTGPIYHIPNM
jgi:hypothetical protein